MATRLFTAVIFSLASFVAAGGAETNIDRDESAIQVAKAWFTSLMQGETAVTTSLSEVPFNFDGKQTVKKHSDLRQLYDQVVATKGKRDLKPTSFRIKSSSPEQIEVVLMFEGEDEGVSVLVTPGEAFRVIGFVD